MIRDLKLSDENLKIKRVLFFDSGIGGLSILKAVMEVNPNIEPYYLFDSECFPYGDKTENFLIARIGELLERACKLFSPQLIVVACNTASTVALPTLRKNIKIPIVGVVPAIKPAAKLSLNKIVGLFATPGTVRRSYTKNLIDSFAANCKMIKLGSPDLAVIAEQRLCTGYVDTERIREILLPVLTLKEDQKPDVVVLGCTHYPFIRDIFEKLMPNTKFIDSGEAIGRRVKALLAKLPYKEVLKAEPRIFFTGNLKNYGERLHMIKPFGFSKLEKFD